MKLTNRKIVVAGMLGAISIVLGISGLGLIPVPTMAGNVTIMHVPTILGGVLEGPLVGLLIGLIFGLFSFMQASSPLFADPLVSIIPRLFIGITSYLVYAVFKKKNKNLGLISAGIVGTATNTILVLGMGVIRGYIPFEGALSIAVIHGIPEAIVATLLTLLIGRKFTR
ncbi:ECF transporter S component [Halothermothrix orenii]|uniref:Predicted membrane protein n=1 Tax=Halothermothrix orenii (strain H 168 / OCM 544 / DSM 9562) TaxID=373903 RepID=B8CWC1_HALOH|nr:ECF transporter S component [Halothermothrix orenii]ACL69590.1 predicted membrane protein [Halothermothrix orenii H 168]